MMSLKKPFLAAIGLMTILVACLFVSAGPATAYPAGVAPVVTVNPQNPSCGQSVTVSGQHYKPNKTVTISVNGTKEATATTDSNGSFSVTFTLTCQGTGPQTIKASGGGVDALTVHTGGNNGNGNGGNNNGNGGLSSTGVAVVGIGAVGVVLLLGGGLLLFAGKRRRTV